MQYVQPVGAPGGAPYVDANPGAGQEGSPVPAAAIEHPMRELVALISDAGLTPTNADLAQVGKAIKTIFQKAAPISAAASGTVDAITANYTPAIATLFNHLLLIVRAGGANTITTPTFTPASATIPPKTIVKGHNQALAAGDISGAGFRAELQYDASLDKWVLLNPATAMLGAIDNDLGGSVDLNNVVKSGFYRLPGTITNSPAADANFGQMIVIHGGQDTISQIVFSYSTGNVYVRSGNPTSVGGSGSFMAWKRLAMATELADKLPIDGSVAMTGKLQARSGVATAGNTGNCGFVFSGDTDSGMFGGADGMIDLVVNGLIAFRASYTHDRTFNFGPLNAWKFKMQDDGNVAVYDNFNQPKFSSLDFSSFYTRLIDTNGHQKLPGGLIMQWCTVGDGVSTSADSAISANFPVSFPNECFGVIAILVRDTALSNTWGVYAKANNLSSFTVVMDGVSPGSTAKTLFCIALGK